MFMYSGYSSYDSEIQRHLVCQSPLVSTVSLTVAEQIAKPFLEHLNELILTNRSSTLNTDKDFKWALEIFAFGFTCEESSIHQLCANIYVEWLKVFEARSSTLNSIPAVLREKTEFYWAQMFWHLYHLFVIHDERTANLLSRRMNTHKVLRQLQIMISQTDLTTELWHILLQVFLAIGDTVLSSPYRTNDEASAVMSHRLMPSIYQVFMVAVSKVHIPPGLWRTFRDYAQTWRHRPAVVYDWAQLTCVLTSTIVHKLWCPHVIPLQYTCNETDQGDYVQKIIDALRLDVLLTTWIEFLTILQNPSECGDVSVFLRLPRYANQFQNNPSLKWKDFTSLQELPRIFVNVTNAIGMFVDIWLGKEIDRTCLSNPKPSNNSTATMNDNTPSTAMGNNPTGQARLLTQSVRGNPPTSQQASSGTLKPGKAPADNRRVSTKKSVSIPSGQSIAPLAPTVAPTPPPSINLPARVEQTNKSLRANRPSVNSLMHLYGPWILDACLLQTKDRYSRSSTMVSASDAFRPTEIDKTMDLQNERYMDDAFAKSFATLCTIFTSAQCDEFIYPEYLSRFYYVLQQGLRLYQGDEERSRTIIESILLHSADLFRINLPGINILLPLYLDAIEFYLQSDLQTYTNTYLMMRGNTNASIIRDRFIRIRSQCIQILLSITALPYHYEYLPQRLFEDYLEKSHDVQTTTTKTFAQHRRKIFPLLLRALPTELDVVNVQLLFGAIRLACSLIAHCEPPQQQRDEKVTKDIVSEYSSRAIDLICDKGTTDPQLFLAALDTLISFVTDPIFQLQIHTWKNVLARLCTFIDTQLHRSPRDHTREMHSTCVAAYNTLVTLIIEQPTLLDDPETLYRLCEIIELGVSGGKAQTSDRLTYKKEKIIGHAASQRVAEAAEYLMCVLFEHKTINQITNVSQRSITGVCFHAEQTGDHLNEEAVLHLKNDICRNGVDESTFANLIQSTRFKYFAMNDNTLFAINELPISVNQGLPAVILLCRGLFGKNVWTLKFRQNPSTTSTLVPRNQSQERTSNENGKSTPTSTPSPAKDQRDKPTAYHKSRNEYVKSDCSIMSSLSHLSEFSIPPLDSIIKRAEEKLNRLRALKTRQMKIEEQAIYRMYQIEDRITPECKPPECQKHFEGIRLFLSHYGFCSIDSIYHMMHEPEWNQAELLKRLRSRIQPLDSTTPSFMEDLKKLDQISPTLYCTGQIFYLKRHQSHINESFSNMNNPEQLNPSFLKMVRQFGSVAEIQRHCGWTGNVETSWRTVSGASTTTSPPSKTLAQIDGTDSILYWVDLTTEMAFYLPHQFSADASSPDLRILIVWLEEFPESLDSLLSDSQAKTRDVAIIGIHPLKNHLFRILLDSNAQRMQSSYAGLPLIDGMVVPLDILAFFLRQAVHTLSRRKRLEDSQSSQTAYAVRKNRISKLIQKYQNRTNDLDDYFQQIFFSSSTANSNTPRQPTAPGTTRAHPMIVVQS